MDDPRWGEFFMEKVEQSLYIMGIWEPRKRRKSNVRKGIGLIVMRDGDEVVDGG